MHELTGFPPKFFVAFIIIILCGNCVTVCSDQLFNRLLNIATKATNKWYDLINNITLYNDRSHKRTKATITHMIKSKRSNYKPMMLQKWKDKLYFWFTVY